jgi:hypothetical protein
MTGPSAEKKNRAWMIRTANGVGAALRSPLKVVRAGIGVGAALKSPLKGRTWTGRAGIGAAAAVVIVGIGVALVALLGRPAVSVSSGERLSRCTWAAPGPR